MRHFQFMYSAVQDERTDLATNCLIGAIPAPLTDYVLKGVFSSCLKLLSRIVVSVCPDQPELQECWGYKSSPHRLRLIALKAAIRSQPGIFFQTCITCLLEGVFSSPWRLQKLVSLPEGSKPQADTPPYRPLCVVDKAGMILEQTIANRIEEVNGGAQVLSDRQ